MTSKAEQELLSSQAQLQPPRGSDAMIAGSLATPQPRGTPDPIDDPIQRFKASFDAGILNIQAQTDNFRASINALMGDEKGMVDALNDANRAQRDGAWYLEDAEKFDEFLDNPTFGGFINQAIQATGQFAPSAVVSIALAMTGAGVGAGITAGVARTAGTQALTKAASKKTLSKSIAAMGQDKSTVEDIVKKYVSIETAKARNKRTKLAMEPGEMDVINALYKDIRNKRIASGAKVGALVGAGSQEQVMGQGIAFGDYAEQGMTGRDEVFKSSLQGLGFTALGLGSEVAVARSVAKAVNKKALSKQGFYVTKEGKIFTKNAELIDQPIKSRRRRLAEVAGTTSVAEGLAEAGQEELSVQQKLRIDESYTRGMANLDRLNALFAGVVGGVGIGTAIGTPSAVMGKAYDQMLQGHVKAAQMAFDTEIDSVAPETEADLRAQFDAMADPKFKRDLVWVVKGNEDAMNNLEPEMRKKFPNMQVVEIEGAGTLYTTNSRKAEGFANYMSANVLSTSKLNGWLANNLGYTREQNTNDDRAVVIFNKDGAVVWGQRANQEDEDLAISAAERELGVGFDQTRDGFTIETIPLEAFEANKKEGEKKVTPINKNKSRMDRMEFDEDGNPLTDEERGFVGEEQETTGTLGVSEQKVMLEPLQEGRGSINDPVTKRNSKEGWAVVDYNLGRQNEEGTKDTDKIAQEQELIKDARALLPPEFQEEFEQELAAGRFSESLLNEFIKENNQETSGAIFYKIEKRPVKNDYVLIRHRIPGVGPVPVPEKAKKDAFQQAKDYGRRKRGNRFAVVTKDENGQDQSDPIDVPFLTKIGRTFSQTYEGEFLEGGDAGSAISGLAFALSTILPEGARITFDGKPFSLNPVFYGDGKGKTAVRQEGPGADPAAVVFEQVQYVTDKNGEPVFDTVEGEQVQRKTIVRKTLVDLLNEEDSTYGVEPSAEFDPSFDPRTDIQEESKLETRETRNQFVRDDSGKVLGQEKTFVQVEDQDAGRYSYDEKNGIFDDQLEGEFNRRVFKSNYSDKKKPVGRFTKKLSPFQFSTTIEQELGAEFLRDFAKLMKPLGLSRGAKVFSVEENIEEQILKDLPADLSEQQKKDILNEVEMDRRKVRDGIGGTIAGNLSNEYTSLPYDVIFIRTRTANPVADAQGNPTFPKLDDAQQGVMITAVAHEIGHTFYRQELERSLKIPAIRKRLEQAFQKELETNDTGQYQGENGFEEWMADQTAAYLLDNTIKAQDAAGSFFKGIANKIRAFFKQYTEFFKKRFKRNPAFTDYVAEVTQLAKDPGRQMAYEYKAFIEGQVEQLGKEIPFGDPKAPKKIFDTMKFITGTGTVDKSVSFFNSLLNTSDDILRQLGEPGRALANIFRSLSQSEELTGMFTSAQSISLSKMNEITEILGIKPYTYVGTVKSLIPYGKKLGIKADEGITEEIMEVLYEAENEEIATKDLKDPRAKALRQWFTDHYNGKGMGMSLKEVGIKFRENYFTRKLDVHEISGNPIVYDALVKLIMAKSPTPITQAKAEAVVNGIIADPGTSSDIDISESTPGDFAIGLTKKRVLAFENITTSELRAINAIVEPHVALQSYIDNTVKKVELKKRGGPQQIEKHIQEIKEQFGEEKAQLATDVVRSMLGKHAQIGGMLRGVNQIGLLWNVTTLLTFATFASFPDVAGPILRSRSFKELRQNMSLIFDQLSRDEATKLAYDIGAISMDAMTQTYVGAGELDYLSADTKEKTNAFFRLVGLEQFTKFTRIFAASMGKSFLLNNAEKAKAGDAKAQANLRELNVTADQVLSWAGGDVTAAGNEAVKQALARFVDESIVRPNSAERPAWANDPRYALVWQLKQFFYSYGKTIVGGNLREMQRRYENEGIRGASVPLFMGALTLLPLTMLGFDLRERFKIGMAYVLPGVSPSDKNYRRSKEMDWGEYTIEIIDRSGVLGPFTMALPLFMSEKRYGDPLWVGPLGPSVEKGYDLLTGNLRVKDLTPFYSSL